jgi:hypothetical protein
MANLKNGSCDAAVYDVIRRAHMRHAQLSYAEMARPVLFEGFTTTQIAASLNVLLREMWIMNCFVSTDKYVYTVGPKYTGMYWW